MPFQSRHLLSIALSACLALCVAPRPAGAQDVTVGTGSTSGVYFQVGRVLCLVLTRLDPVEGLGCEAVPTAGSISNLEALRAGELQLGVVQSDWHFHAVNGTGPFEAAGPDAGLRALFSVHGEPFTLVVRADAGIGGLTQLEGRRVNIGNPGSGQRGTMEAVMEAMGWSQDDFSLAEQLNAAEHSLALCHDKVEAFVYTVGHPNASISRATGLCDARIVPVEGAEIDALLAAQPYYVKTEIPGGVYNANPEPVPTFGVIATVVATEAMEEATAYAIVRGLFENLDAFRAAHPAFALLDPAAMAMEGLSAPLHPGAERYYREAGLIGSAPAQVEQMPSEAAPAVEAAPEADAAGEEAVPE